MFDQVDIVHGSYISESLKEYEKTEIILQTIGTRWNNIGYENSHASSKVLGTVSNKETLQILTRDFFVE